jgi:hypothetical protein
VEKSYCLNIQTLIVLWKEYVSMDIASYFELVKYTMMAATFIVLVLVFLYVMYGKEDRES